MGVPIHPTEFRVADPYPDRLPDLVSGLPPALLAALALLVLGALLIGLALGRGAARPPASGAAAIWKAIDDACQAAMKAHTDALPDKAAVLGQVIQARLGRTLALSDGMLRPLAALDRALAGRPEPRADDHHDEPDHGRHASGESEESPHGDAHRRDVDHVAAEAAVTIVNNGRVEIRSGGGPHHHPPADQPGHAPGHPPHKPAPPPRDLTAAQRADALRRAVSDLNDHWRRKGQRLEELDAAWRELCVRPDHRRPVRKAR